ncbi:hypothetical protein FK531_05525 [Rhodococcus spelaei]|uniref:Recombinase n=1 Tax=Rhodococcus spelaei TaxID=2546320 RepID=A0A541BP52_9NOCA|nr:hypothetical protein [Rhodococcus spelaei]TQF74113.1 hypothetical protein FK531_05525 [Rhodococcus spelaei]
MRDGLASVIAGRDAPRSGPDRRYRHDWALFADWAAAANLDTLPADPTTLATFLAENPAAPATHRRRVSAVNHVHERVGLPAPGRAETIRSALDTNRSARLARAKHQVRQRLPEVPTAGWPQGLFGRRDGLLLVLAASGLGFERISRLRRSEVSVENDTLFVAGAHPVRLDAHPDPRLSPAAVYRRWADVLAFTDRHPSTRLLAHHLERGEIPGGTPLPDSDAPLLTSIDRWGYLPLQPIPLTAASVAAIAEAHLNGRAPTHTAPARRAGTATTPEPERAENPECISAPLGEYFDHGIAARRAAHTALSDVGDLLDTVEDHADRLLEQTLAIIEDWPEADDPSQCSPLLTPSAADF